MSKRITLTDFEIEQIVKALEALRKETNLSYEVIKCGQRFYEQLIDKLQTSKLTELEGKPNAKN